MKTTIITLIIAVITVTGYSQNYERQLGMRFGTMAGISGKVIVNKATAIQGTLGFRKGGVQLYTLLEAYKCLDKSSNQNWYLYFGGGAHIGYVNGYNRIRRWSNTNGYYSEEERAIGPVFGLDVIMGVEYNIPAIPLVVFFEVKPLVELQNFDRVRTHFWDNGIGIAYKFNN